ncbi:hypothetical protein BG006_003036 [Podila minutissima]|uniref:Uncharacterized protein n=1 Tax=Podila minutissima TaxID=64525 RepID=A0A9P5SMI1_9FUNG|nr:hypothetical protein BG006_003036 [Podila minutissima]
MIVGIGATLTAGLLDKGVARFIEPAARLGNDSNWLEVTEQAIARSVVRKFSGWSTAIRYNEDITSAMALLLNSTRNIQGPKTGRTYIPRRFPYEIDCQQFNVVPIAGRLDVQNYGGCGTVAFGQQDTLDSVAIRELYINTTITKGSSGRVSIIVNQGLAPLAVSLSHPAVQKSLLNITQEGYSADCATLEHLQAEYTLGQDVPDVVDLLGYSFPVTVTNKCLDHTGRLRILSMTTVRYLTSRLKHFNNSTTHYFEDDSDELLVAMKKRVRKIISGFEVRDPQPAPLMVMELKVNGSSIDYITCSFVPYWEYDTEGTLECVYAMTSTLILKPRTPIPELVFKPKGKRIDGADMLFNPGVAMIIEHSPKVAEDGRPEKVSLSRTREATMKATLFMAELGHNFITEFDFGELWVLYDTQDAIQGLEIPGWVLIIVASS